MLEVTAAATQHTQSGVCHCAVIWWKREGMKVTRAPHHYLGCYYMYAPLTLYFECPQFLIVVCEGSDGTVREGGASEKRHVT